MDALIGRAVAVSIGLAALGACGGTRTTATSEASPPPSASAVAIALPVSTSPSAPAAHPDASATSSSTSAENVAASSATATPFASACEGMALEVSLKKPSTGLEVVATLRNKGKAAVDVMLTGDGSSFERRNPTVRFELTPNDVAAVGTCGFINAVTDEEFVTLKPGDGKKLEWLHPPTPGKPGRYTLRTTYRNDPKFTKLSGVPHALTAAQAARQAKTTPCEVTSNALAFTWDGKTAKPAP